MQKINWLNIQLIQLIRWVAFFFILLFIWVAADTFMNWKSKIYIDQRVGITTVTKISQEHSKQIN